MKPSCFAGSTATSFFKLQKIRFHTCEIVRWNRRNALNFLFLSQEIDEIVALIGWKAYTKINHVSNHSDARYGETLNNLLNTTAIIFLYGLSCFRYYSFMQKRCFQDNFLLDQKRANDLKRQKIKLYLRKRKGTILTQLKWDSTVNEISLLWLEQCNEKTWGWISTSVAMKEFLLLTSDFTLWDQACTGLILLLLLEMQLYWLIVVFGLTALSIRERFDA